MPVLPEQVEHRIRYFYLTPHGLIEGGFRDFDALTEAREQHDLIWLHLSGTLGEEFFEHLKSFLDLTDEQIKYLRSPHRRSFFEDFYNGVFWTMQRPSVTDKADAIETINFLMTEKVIVTRQFSHDNAFAFVSHKLMERAEHFADATVDTLATILIEDVINSYVELLKYGGTRLEEIQNKIIRKPGKEELQLINRAQQTIWIFLNAIWPVETVLQAFEKCGNPLVTERGRRLLSYRQDEAAAVIRLFETYRAMSYNLMDVYVSGLSLRTNETTTVLTMIATLFLPPTLIAGIYGMNFNIPEVHASFGYYICLFFMFSISGGIFVWLKRKGYIDL